MRTPALCLLCLLCLLTPTQGRTEELIILQYHFVSDAGPDSTSVSPERFEAHLRIIEEEGLAVVDLPSALDALSEQDALPERAVAITFDDGYVSVYRHAFPRLAERSWPFTVFVNPEAIDNGSQAHADWAALRDMQHAGATIANHGMRHAFLVRPPQLVGHVALCALHLELTLSCRVLGSFLNPKAPEPPSINFRKPHCIATKTDPENTQEPSLNECF